MLQLANCCLEYVKAWGANNLFWKRIPLHNYEGEKRVLIVVCWGVQLAKCHRMTTSGWASVWLDIIGEGHSYKIVYYLLEKAKPCVCTSLL